MLESLKKIIDIQEFDMKMIRLMRLKKERQKELEHIDSLRRDLKIQLEEKENEISELSKNISNQEAKIVDFEVKIKQLEAKQLSIKKVDEFNALTQELTQSERAKSATELTTSDLIDKKNLEEEILEKIKGSLKESEDSSLTLLSEIKASIHTINAEGREIKVKRDALAQGADEEVLKIYERLLQNKKDRVIVPIENRTCSGCHISLTAQHENLVRRGERLIFCEHCSRIHFWSEVEPTEGSDSTKRRRRRLAKV